jgi:hypothetical protein
MGNVINFVKRKFNLKMIFIFSAVKIALAVVMFTIL